VWYTFRPMTPGKRRRTPEARGMRNARSIFRKITREPGDPLPHVAPSRSNGQLEQILLSADRHIGTTLLRGRVRPDLITKARAAAKEGGITLGAYITAQVMDRPITAAVPHGLTDAFLERVAASSVVQRLDAISHAVREPVVDVPALSDALRMIAGDITAGSGMLGEVAEEMPGDMLAVRVPIAVAQRAKREADKGGFSLVAYLTQLIEEPSQPVPVVQQDALGAGMPLAFAGLRIASAVATVRKRVTAGEGHLADLLPAMRLVQVALAEEHLRARADYDRCMDQLYGERDDIGWSAGFLDDEEDQAD
jgi:hypothetical protein